MPADPISSCIKKQFLHSCQKLEKSDANFTRWSPKSCKWSYNLCKWPYRWVKGVIPPVRPISGVALRCSNPTVLLIRSPTLPETNHNGCDRKPWGVLGTSPLPPPLQTHTSTKHKSPIQYCVKQRLTMIHDDAIKTHHS